MFEYCISELGILLIAVSIKHRYRRHEQ